MININAFKETKPRTLMDLLCNPDDSLELSSRQSPTFFAFKQGKFAFEDDTDDLEVNGNTESGKPGLTEIFEFIHVLNEEESPN